MSSRPRIDFTQVQRDTLVLLHERFRSDQRGLSVVEIAKCLGVSRNEVRAVVRDEIKDGHCQENYSGPGEPEPLSNMPHGVLASMLSKKNLSFNFYIVPDERHLELTRSGVEFVNDFSDSAYQMSMKRLSQAQNPQVIVPASDRTVTLDHNQAAYKEAVAALDKVIGEFRNDQRLDNELGREKGALLKALEGGRELLNDMVINVRIGTALILEPLWRLIEKYEHALVGAAAQAAYDLIKMLFS